MSKIPCPACGGCGSVEGGAQLAPISDDFSAWWAAYPRKVGKRAAQLAWKRAKPPALDVLLRALAWQKESEEWQKDGGLFIPHPATYLNQGRWEDEPRQLTMAKQLGISDANARAIAAWGSRG